MWVPDPSKIITIVMKQAEIDSNRRGAVIIERNRRLALGFSYDFKDTRGVHRIATSEQDMKGWDEVSTIAGALFALGDVTTQIDIVTDTGPTKITALEWQEVLAAAGSFRQPIWAASFALSAMMPMPDDITADQYWP